MTADTLPPDTLADLPTARLDAFVPDGNGPDRVKLIVRVESRQLDRYLQEEIESWTVYVRSGLHVALEAERDAERARAEEWTDKWAAERARAMQAEADLAALRAERERLLRIEAAAREFLTAEDDLTSRRSTLMSSPSEWVEWINEARVEASKKMAALRAALAPEGGTVPTRGAEQEAGNG